MRRATKKFQPATRAPAPVKVLTAAELRENATWGRKQIEKTIEHAMKENEEQLAKFADNFAINPQYAFDWAEKAREAAATNGFWMECKAVFENRTLRQLLDYVVEQGDRNIGYANAESNDSRVVSQRYIAKAAHKFASEVRRMAHMEERYLLLADGVECGL